MRHPLNGKNHPEYSESLALLSVQPRDELKLLVKIGAHLSRMLSGRAESPLASDRRDELGMLANMVGRVTTDLAESRERDRRLQLEIERRIGELEAAHATQERLLDRIRELSSPVLNPLPGVLLVPLIGALDAERAALVTTALLERVASVKAAIVILDVTGVQELDHDWGALGNTEVVPRHIVG
jgi:rsbT co-antagonist protein RsbR